MSSAYFDTSGVIACLLEARAALAAQRRARTLRSRAYAQAKEGWPDRELCRASVERGIAVLDLNLS